MKSFKQFVEEEMGSGSVGIGTTTSGGNDPIEKQIAKKIPRIRRLTVPEVPVTMPTHVTKEDTFREGTVADQKITTTNNAKTDPNPTGFVEKSKKESEGTVGFAKKLKTKKEN